MSFKFEMCEIVLSLKIFQISRYNELNSNKQFISVFKYKITVIVEKLNVTRGLAITEVGGLIIDYTEEFVSRKCSKSKRCPRTGNVFFG